MLCVGRALMLWVVPCMVVVLLADGAVSLLCLVVCPLAVVAALISVGVPLRVLYALYRWVLCWRAQAGTSHLCGYATALRPVAVRCIGRGQGRVALETADPL